MKAMYTRRNFTVQPIFHVDYELYILVLNAIVDRMVHRVPLKHPQDIQQILSLVILTEQ